MKRRSRRPRTKRPTRIVAWAGLLLLAASFLCFHFLAPPSQRSASGPRVETTSGPFSLVVLDPGHGGRDSGAEYPGVLEKDLTLDVAQRAERLLRIGGLTTSLTRDRDVYVSLADRAAFANRARSCVFVSIHFNDEKKTAVSGVETYYAARSSAVIQPVATWFPFWRTPVAEPLSGEGESLAGFIQTALVGRTQAVNRGTKAGNYFVIINVRHPAVLMEGGFLTNKADVAKLATGEYREQLAAAISEGVLRYREAVAQREITLAAATP